MTPDVRCATKYLSPTLVVRCTRPRFKRGNDVRLGQFVVTVGRPNYEAREKIKLFKKAKEPFPVKKVQLKFVAKKR